ncbi:hypothetical protein [Puia dinghuensis]|uniref:Outer membrane protein beta-barrel domain-containing protein n=1 Tax=Puia dinghuensis TaxID=1792502 RepID=A0A8J2XRH3_9BACT|nr:hypothetical protein [Puia dinghuensis]GGA89142.1 hypothetical protein GCM10011511_10460 [Puia dinghuensis]
MRPTIIILTVLLIFCSANVNAQSAARDSVNYYQSQLYRLYRQTWDSLRKSDSVVYYARGFKKAKRRSKSYTAFVLFTEAAGADFSTFNAAIAKDGFGALNGPIWRVGMGLSHKSYNGLMIDFNFFALGINRGTSYGNAAIHAGFSDLLQLQLGYAVLNTRGLSIYPYAGLSGRSSQIQFSKPAVLNNTFNSVAGIVQNNQSVDEYSSHLSYQAGLGVDWTISESTKSEGGTILFAKFGTDGIFGDESYGISGINYTPGIKYGAWTAALGFKFFGR